jgi:hypothetical protein
MYKICTYCIQYCTVSVPQPNHRNQSINRKGTYILADVLAMDNSTVGAATRLFCGFFLK